jgi:hypothetical protein
METGVELWIRCTGEHGARKGLASIACFFVCLAYGGLFKRLVDIFSAFREDEIVGRFVV